MNAENINIVLEAGAGYRRWPCQICGEWQDDGMSSKLEIELGDNGKLTLRICRTCLDAGAKGAGERALEYANHLRQHAETVEQFPDFLRSISEWKTGADYDAVVDEFEQPFREELAIYEKEISDKASKWDLTVDDPFPF